MIGRIVRFVLAGCGLGLSWMFASVCVLPATGSDAATILASLGMLALYWPLVSLAPARPRASKQALDSQPSGVITTGHLLRDTDS